MSDFTVQDLGEVIRLPLADTVAAAVAYRDYVLVFTTHGYCYRVYPHEPR